MRAVLSIGSNMDDRLALLQLAHDYFAEELVIASSIYATPPWGVEDQDDFLNAILVIETSRDPYALLEAAHEVEDRAERRRLKKWGPRTLDIDIVQCSEGNIELTSTDPVLTLPHPWAHDRAFVLVPWLEVEPDAILRGKSVSALLAQMPADNVAEVRKVDTFAAGITV
ncbi:2-amino-4-hydroxy-6-hydroxymethyldihydropteridine diphosphokinase [Corynebacterium epidermidicanis]|uniref:2-amino-4-hydroxy-6-hydroxymethyldihydropteridine diphosphokinase n=1 Tax=Corynebacterium epidermidicanis TaxID=1050174 RepID=A0A0G3GYP2_9CORY|nr:2-amino-4-hydroxy-6-hydroxymethyldihydropteridine diphosphokinase [Corynebacterium epidermidicanis]AKK03987.1 2-amino-4-hydroxy-6-hydroxymethyldihydropteridine diphosphokinase [Corynebacterium epidermidicanis]